MFWMIVVLIYLGQLDAVLTSNETEFSSNTNYTEIPPANGSSVMQTASLKSFKLIPPSKTAPPVPPSIRPNVIIVLADDLGYGDLASWGHPTSTTPFIDTLVRKSKVLTKFYVTSPICSPSRASLLTGRYQVRSGVYPGTFTPDSTLGLPRNETTVAQLFKNNGYRTAIIGKWHLGVGRDREYLPTNFGFDHYLGVPYSHDMCPCRTCFPGGRPCHDMCWADKVSCPLFKDSTIIKQPVDLTTLTSRFVSSAIEFITSSSDPFFLYLPFHHVHHPQFSSGRFYNSSTRGIMGDALNELDWAMEQVVKSLVKSKLYENTIIWFTSDNGPSMTRHERGGCAGLLRCGKGTTMEGGVRVPAFVHWTKKIPAGRSSALVSTLDILPTVAALTNTSVGNLTLDGYDVSNVLLKRDGKSTREYYAIYPEGPKQEYGPFAVIHGSFKAHFYTKGSDLSDASNYDPMCPAKHKLTKHIPPLLYNIDTDPGERYNVALENKKELEQIIKWRNMHMKTITWMSGRTQIIDSRAQPCCTVSTCIPFPKCCDCAKENIQFN